MKDNQEENISNKCIVNEHKGDLFLTDNKASLAHCVSVDLRMGKGIAVEFKKRFGGIGELKKQSKVIGEVAVLKREERFIYYLITKQNYWNKPTYEDLYSCLVEMKKHCIIHRVKHLCMPKIGCGLDRLLWNKVKPMIQEVFSDIDLVIDIYSL